MGKNHLFSRSLILAGSLLAGSSLGLRAENNLPKTEVIQRPLSQVIQTLSPEGKAITLILIGPEIAELYFDQCDLGIESQPVPESEGSFMSLEQGC